MNITVGTATGGALKTTALIIIAVAAFSVFFWWRMSRLGEHAERVQNDPAYLRKSLRRGAYLYIGATALAITMVILGESPKETLFGLPVGLLLIWFFSYSAAKVKLPPK